MASCICHRAWSSGIFGFFGACVCIIGSLYSHEWPPTRTLALVTGELTSRLTTAALPFGLSPWTYDSASPAVRQGRHLTAMPAASGGGLLSPRRRVELKPICNLTGNSGKRQSLSGPYGRY